MSVESEILRIQHNIADAYAAVSDKGGEVPLQPTSANLAPAIASIQASSGSTDGTPVGTVISFMGLSAPDGYLVCDGAVYDISAYPKLANFINAQFGSFGYFGGDGTTTFAVPDMRNLFVRGYHGEAEEQLSGNIGKKQAATIHTHVRAISNGFIQTFSIPTTTDSTENPDTTIENNPVTQSTTVTHSSYRNFSQFTSRPVNMSVLFCIKAYSPGNNRGDEYSTEEIPVGTWIDGKALYRLVFSGTTGNSNIEVTLKDLSFVDTLVNDRLYIKGKSGSTAKLPSFLGFTYITDTKRYCINITTNDLVNQPYVAIIEYTKTTD